MVNMPRSGITAYDLLISCPGDVIKYVDVIRECVDGFNRTIGRVNNAEIAVRHWSTDSYPQSGDKPQELLNKQFVQDCDAAVAILWTKFGTPTDKYGSGTEEEIEEMLSSDKQVFMYFLDVPVNPQDLDISQYEKVREFREKYKDKGIYFVVKDENDLRKQFTNHLAMHFLPLVAGEKMSPVPTSAPLLQIEDINAGSSKEFIVMQSSFLESELLENKKNIIIGEISALKENYLPRRAEVKPEEKSVNPILKETIDIQKLLGSAYFKNGEVSAVTIPDEWKSNIVQFASKNGIEISSDFWNLGNLDQRVPVLRPAFVGSGVTLEGSDDEQERYHAIEDLYCHLQEYNEYSAYFSEVDEQNIVELILANVGNTFDEDIDVKLIFKKDSVLSRAEIPIPGIDIMKEILDMDFLRFVYKIRVSDSISKYSGYPAQLPTYTMPVPFESDYEIYNKQKQQYQDDIREIFCYQFFTKDDCDILTFHVDYLKHNTKMAFPSVLVLKNSPEIIEYEITSKYIADVVKGALHVGNKT